VGGHQVDGAAEGAGLGADVCQAGFGRAVQVDEFQEIRQRRGFVGSAVA